jgi:hypothetical protein
LVIASTAKSAAALNARPSAIGALGVVDSTPSAFMRRFWPLLLTTRSRSTRCSLRRMQRRRVAMPRIRTGLARVSQQRWPRRHSSLPIGAPWAPCALRWPAEAVGPSGESTMQRFTVSIELALRAPGAARRRAVRHHRSAHRSARGSDAPRSAVALHPMPAD